jgi:hypothetical protein
MDFKTRYPEYVPVEEHIRRARLERSVAIAHAIAGLLDAIVRGTRRLANSMSAVDAAQADARAIAVDPFLQRGVAHR